MTEFENEMVVRIAARGLAQRSTMAALLFALGESKTVEIDRVLAFVDVLAATFRQPVSVADPMSLRTMALAAEEMAELRPAMMRMVTIPPGAGRA